MSEVRYVPAGGADGWRAAVSADATAVLSPSVTPQTADAVWRRLDGGGIGALVEALTGAFGTSLTAIPPFALVMVEGDDVRIAVRGPLEVVVETANGAESVSGRGVATWAERLCTRVLRATVAFDGALDESSALPIASGVVPVAGLVLTVGTPTTPTRMASPAGRVAAPGSPEGTGDTEGTAAPEPSEPSEGHEVADTSEPSAGSAALGVSEAAEDAPAQAVADGAAEEPSDQPSSATTVSPTTPTHDAPSDTWIPPSLDLVDDVPFTSAAMADDRTVAAPRRHAGGPGGGVPAPPVVSTPASAPASAPAGDHDGATISVAEARAMRGLPAVFEPVADVPARQPARGRVRLSTGQVVELERPVIIGRRPRSPRASGSELPTLIAVDSPQGDISRSHVEIKAEGEHVLVTDLATTNGTVLRRGGQEPVRLHPNEPTMVVTGDTIDLGDGVTATFEDLP